MKQLIFAAVVVLLSATSMLAQTATISPVVKRVGAPGPIMGAGLPLLAAGGIGYGIYWAVRRRRRKI